MNRTDIPAPIYAAAGAGEIAYEKLRKLPAVAARTADGLRQRLATPDRDRNLVDLARVRETARRGTAQLAAQAAGVQDRAVAGYRRLVARGERVMADRLNSNTAPLEPAGIEVEVGPVRPAEPAASKPKQGARDGSGGAATAGSDAGTPSGGTASGR